MKFSIHPWTYSVTICPGELFSNGVPCAATVCDREILIDGTLDADDRLDALIDQLYRIRRKHHGIISPAGLSSFTVDLLRQLIAQGGEAALATMTPAPVEERRAA